MNKNTEHDLVRKLRIILSQCKSTISDGTKRGYEKKYAQMLSQKKGPDGIAQTSGSYYAYRAAFIYGTAEEAREALRMRDRMPPGSTEWHSAIEKIQTCIHRFDRYPPDKNQQHQNSGSSSFTWSDVKASLIKDGVRVKRHSKKYLLAALLKRGDWSEKIFEALPDHYKQLAAVMSLTGCRPSELVKGVQISLTDEKLFFVIRGTKVTGLSGQESRLLVIDMSSPAARFLAEQMEGTNPITVALKNQKSFAEALAAAGKKAFPRLRGRVSPYVWRHAFSSNLKSSGLLPEQVAVALGHRVTRTQEHYGRHSHGCGTVGLVAVHASTEIRDTQRDPRRLSQIRRSPTRSPSLIF